MSFYKNKFQMLILRHSLALAVGLVVVLFVSSPNIRALHMVGFENFMGVYPTFSNDEITYQARIKEVSEGNYAIGNPYIEEHKGDSFLMPPIAELIMASGVWLTNTSVPFIAMIGDGVFVFVNFLLMYAFLYILTSGSRNIALLYTGIFFLCVLDSMGRPISPQLNYVFLFSGMVCIAVLYVRKDFSSKYLNVLGGLITGITSFISPYFFSSLVVLHVALRVSSAIVHRDYNIMKRDILWFLLSFVPIVSLFLYFQYKASLDPSYVETAIRYGVMHTRIPGSFTNIALAFGALVVSLCAYVVLTPQMRSFCFSAVASIFVLNWQNVITGISFQFAPHYIFVTIPIVLSVCAIIHHRIISCDEGYYSLKRVIAVMLFMFLCVVVYFQRNEFMSIAHFPYTKSELIHMQEKMKIFSWLRMYTDTDSVVYALGGDYNHTIPVYTENRIYSSNYYGALYPSFNEEVEYRWLAQHLFYPMMSTSSIADVHREYWGNRYVDSYDSKVNRQKIIALLTHNEYRPTQRIPTELSEDMYNRWLDLKTKSPIEVLRRYKINYILLSKEYPHYIATKTQLESLDAVSMVADIDGELLYEIQI